MQYKYCDLSKKYVNMNLTLPGGDGDSDSSNVMGMRGRGQNYRDGVGMVTR